MRISSEKKIDITFYSVFVLYGMVIAVLFLVFALAQSSLLMFMAAVIALGIGIITPIMFYYSDRKQKKEIAKLKEEFKDEEKN